MVQERIDPWFALRIHMVFIGLLAAFIGLGVRLYIIQIVDHGFYQDKADRQQIIRVALPARRGTIYDVNGMTLAVTEKASTICLAPGQFGRKTDAVPMLAGVFNMPPDIIRQRLASGKQLVYIRRQVSDEYAAQVRALNLPGIHFKSEDRRAYPNGALFCHILGFTNVDQNGLEGLELYYNSLLTGRAGEQEINRNALCSSGAAITWRTGSQPKENGVDLYLTLDGYVQGVTEEVIRKAWDDNQPDAIMALAVDPRTGRVLAMANLPNFDPAQPGQAPTDIRRNRVLTDAYEPGSVLKVFTAAGAINDGMDPLNTIFDCENGVFFYKGRTLHDHDAYDKLNLVDVIVNSSNIGIAKVGIAMGMPAVAGYLDLFGFGRPTGIEFPGETGGFLRAAKKWDSFTLTSVPMGHEITCTALQLVMAMSAIANGGVLLRPQLVDRVTDPDGKTVTVAAVTPVRRVISERTAFIMREIMAQVVERGTGTKARVEGVRVAGKTGTAQMLITDPATGAKTYSEDAFLSSFCGFAPAEDPRICLIVSVMNPKGKSYYGGSVAAPAVRTIIERTLSYLSAPVLTYRSGS
ncbi:MAG: penicillin-binding protein 2 [Planctomycetota bacterium]